LVAPSQQITNLRVCSQDSWGQTTLYFEEVHRYLDGLFDGDLHAKRILSLTNATLGVIETASLAVNTIGQGLALARGATATQP
jgi:hypothetical protein